MTEVRKDVEIWKDNYPKSHDIKLITIDDGGSKCLVVHITDTTLPEPENRKHEDAYRCWRTA